MHDESLKQWQHEHVFSQDEAMPGEKRTLIIVLITSAAMVIELIAGFAYGSMALLADGLHMASHAAALAIAFAAYVIARRLANDKSFAFGTGKVNSLAGFSGAMLLLGFALLMMVESMGRLVDPVDIAYDQALMVAFFGLSINAISAWILARTPHHHHDHDHQHARRNSAHDHDHNLRAAYLHVIADAVTSMLAIFALLVAKFQGANWLDPAMGIIGAALVTKWSFSLIRDSARVLLDRQADPVTVAELREAIEAESSTRISDLHCWSIGHGILAAEIALVSDRPQEPEYYKALIPQRLGIVHSAVEVHRCPHFQA